MRLKHFGYLLLISMLLCSMCLADVNNNVTPNSSDLKKLAEQGSNELGKEENSKKDTDSTEVKTSKEDNKSNSDSSASSNNSENKDSSSSSSSSSKDEEADNAFSEGKLKTDTSEEKSETTVKTEILDKVTAEAAGIASITEGFPKDGTVEVIGALRLRSWPWGDVLGEYPNGTSVKVLGVSGEFYLVEVDGKQGYMHKNYVSTSDKPASKADPYYPGNTRSGGSLELKEGIQASKDGAEGKVPNVSTDNGTTGGTTGTAGKKGGSVTGDNGKVVLTVPQICQGGTNTPVPWSACGPTSLGMAIAYYTGKDAGTLTSDLWYKCSTTGQAGTAHAGMVAGAKAYGFSNAQWYYSVTQDWVRQQIKAGKPVIANVTNHYVCIKGIDDSGNIIINDPGKWQVERSFTWSEFCAWWNGGGCTRAAMVLE